MFQKYNQLRGGVLLSYLNMFLGMVIPFFYTPVMLRLLGQAEYGLYSLAHSVIAYLNLLNFGFGATIVRYVAKYRAEDNREQLERVYGFSILLYCMMAVLVLFLGFLLNYNIDILFNKGLSPSEIKKMHVLIAIMTASSALSFPASVFTSMIVAYERFIYRNILNIISTVINPIIQLFLLIHGCKSVGMACGAFIVSLCFLPWNLLYCRARLKLRPKFSCLPKCLIREMFAVSFYNFLGMVVDMLFWATDKVILGMLAGSVTVAVYNVGSTFNHIVISLSVAISSVLAPKITGMVVKKATNNELTKLFIRVGRLQFYIIGLVVSGFFVFGHIFIEIWVGKSYIDSYLIALLSIIPLSVPLIQNTGVAILVARNKQKFRSVTYLLIAVLNVVTTYLCVPHFGGIGAAFCSCVAYLLGQGLIMNIYYHKEIKIDIPLFWRTISKMAVIPCLLMLLGYIGVRKLPISGYPSFFVAVFVYTAIYVMLIYYFTMNDYEHDIIRGPCHKCLKLLKTLVRHSQE